MIITIVRKELTVYSRDGRVVGVAILLAFLILFSLVTGWSTLTTQRLNANQAQRDDTTAFNNQGAKTPHAAAHFGRMAYKTTSPLSVFDPGANPFLGQVIWLEAHTQDPAMFRPAEDFLDLRRLADLSAAGVLSLLLPLLIFLAGYNAFAGERERGTLRQTIASGAKIKKLFIAKFLTTAGIGIVFTVVTIGASMLLVLSADTLESNEGLMDSLYRGLGLVLGYSIYSLALAAIALFISAICQRATSALLILLSIWAISNVLLPRLAASTAEQIYPTPESRLFWANADESIRNARPDKSSDTYKSLEQQVLNRALNKDVSEKEASNLSLNRFALSLEVSEIIGAKAYKKAYQDLYDTYQKQQMVRRFIAILSPVVALRHFSSALSGTDVSAHRHFILAAEVQRKLIVRKMNEDMLLNGAGKSYYYLADTNFWASIPDFIYQQPSAKDAYQSAFLDLLMLIIWCALAIGIAYKVACRQKII